MQKPKPNVSQSSPKGGRQIITGSINKIKKFTKSAMKAAPVATAANQPQAIFIRIHRDFILPVPPVTTANPPPTNPQPTLPSGNHLYLIKGTFEDVARFAGATVDWVIKIARLICDPCGTGQLYIHTTGTTSGWYNLDRDASWREVAPGDALLPGIYEFRPAVPILLSKISERRSHSVTTVGSQSSSTTFRSMLDLRDDGCVVTRYRRSVIASHLIPKRIGSDGAKSIVMRFSGVQADQVNDIHRFSPRIGILLISPLNNLVDQYQLGFYRVMGDTYTLHNFNIDEPDLLVIGFPPDGPLSNSSAARLHNYSATLSVHSGNASLPPTGVFDWHYLQCVITRFGTPEYKNLPNILFFVYQFKSASDDSSDEYLDDDGIEPPYPSYRFDQYLADRGERQRARERHEEIAQWSSGIPSGI